MSDYNFEKPASEETKPDDATVLTLEDCFYRIQDATTILRAVFAARCHCSEEFASHEEFMRAIDFALRPLNEAVDAMGGCMGIKK